MVSVAADIGVQACLTLGDVIISSPITENLLELIMNNGGVDFLQNLENVSARRVEFFEAGFHLPSLSDIHMPEWPKGLTLEHLIKILETPQAKITMLAASLTKYGYDARRKWKKKKKLKRSYDDTYEKIKKTENIIASLAQQSTLYRCNEERKNEERKKEMEDNVFNSSLQLDITKNELRQSHRNLSKALGWCILDSNVGIQKNSQKLTMIGNQMTTAIKTINSMGKDMKDTKEEVTDLNSKLYGKKESDNDEEKKGDIHEMKANLKKLADELIVEKKDETGKVISTEISFDKKLKEWEKKREKGLKDAFDLEKSRLKGEQLQTQRNHATHHNVKTGKYYLLYLKQYKSVFFGRVTKIDHEGVHIIFFDDVFPLQYVLFNRLYKKKESLDFPNSLQLPLHRRCEILYFHQNYQNSLTFKNRKKNNPLYARDDFLCNMYNCNFDGNDENEAFERLSPGNIKLPVCSDGSAKSLETLVYKAHKCITSTDISQIMHEINHWKIYDKGFWSDVKKPHYLINAESKNNGRALRVWMRKNRLPAIISDEDGTWEDDLMKITTRMYRIFEKFGNGQTDNEMKNRFYPPPPQPAIPRNTSSGCAIF